MTAVAGDLPCNWTAYWSRVGRLKGLAQWKSKLQTMGMGTHDGDLNLQQVGELLYTRLLPDGSLHPTALQPCPPPS